MPIPSQKDIYRPLLDLAADGKEHSLRTITPLLADQFGLTPAERAELVPSGEPRFRNRVAWARFKLKKAGLLEIPRRGCFRITARGKQALSQSPKEIPSAFFTTPGPPDDGANEGGTENAPESAHERQPDEVSPDEQIAASHAQLREALASDLLDAVKDASPAFFERLVVDLLHRMGYGGFREEAGRPIGGSNDAGLDGEIKEDRLGLEVVYLQAKRWNGPVQRPEIQKFHGALAGRKARKGVFITTSSFSAGAIKFADDVEYRIVLIDGQQLADFMMDHDVGVTTEMTYAVKKLNADYFSED